MIINEEDLENLRLAGKIAANAINYGRSLIKPGEQLVVVLDKVEKYIQEQGGAMAFPAQIALNEIAAHTCPLADDATVFKVEDICKLDVGVHVDGLIADTATTVLFKESPNYEHLQNIRKASEEALKNVIDIIRPGTTLGEVGLIIQESISKHGLSPIKNLSGHGLGRYSVHESPTVPNFNTNDATELEYNQIIAIEPFATDGHGMIYESSNATLFSVAQQRSVRSQIARDVLKDLQQFKGLPFTTRWLTTKHSVAKLNYAFKELRNFGIIHDYPPLLETKKGMVSQTEHTVIVRDKPIVTTHREE